MAKSGLPTWTETSGSRALPGRKHSGRRYNMKHILTSALGVVGGAIAAAFGGWEEVT